MKKYVIRVVELISEFIREFVLGQDRIDHELVKLTSDYGMVKETYNEVMWGSDKNNVNIHYDNLARLSDFLVMINTVRLEVMSVLTRSQPSSARTHVNAMLSELSDIQEEVEFLLSRHGVVHNQVIEPPHHDGMIKYWRNMNAKHSVNSSLLTLAIF